MGEVLLDFTLQVGAAFVVQQVPFVERENQGAAGFDGQLQDADILFAEHFVHRKEHDGDLRLFECALRAQ